MIPYFFRRKVIFITWHFLRTLPVKLSPQRVQRTSLSFLSQIQSVPTSDDLLSDVFPDFSFTPPLRPPLGTLLTAGGPRGRLATAGGLYDGLWVKMLWRLKLYYRQPVNLSITTCIWPVCSAPMYGFGISFGFLSLYHLPWTETLFYC